MASPHNEPANTLLHISEVLCQGDLEVSPDSSAQEQSWNQLKVEMADMWQPFAEGIWSLASLAQNAQDAESEVDGAATTAVCTSPVRAVEPRMCIATHRLDSLASTSLPESEAKSDDQDDLKPQPQPESARLAVDEPETKNEANPPEDGKDEDRGPAWLSALGLNFACCEVPWPCARDWSCWQVPAAQGSEMAGADLSKSHQDVYQKL
ncbi:unnamed protein product [Durusdinium trenchii]|uniref:Uncharacterized protein n=1 Tax=Durusdinium trenchii TaxID=1381693 RepID=A0ABP0QE56_9DINO